MSGKTNKRVKVLRESKKIGIQEFAYSIGIQHSALSKFENGKQKELPGAAVMKLISIYGIDPDWLAGVKGEDNEPVFLFSDEKQEVEKLKKEKEEMKDKILMYQEELLKYQSKNIDSLKNIEAVSDKQ